jgi:serine/threonine-protein kinase
MTCPACGAATDELAVLCFTCKAPLLAVGQGDLLAARWEIRAFLGRGGMGAVYRAHDRTLNEEVALKVIRPDLMETPDTRDRFTSEIKLARRVSHPGVCRIHEYGEDGRQRFFTMELVEGHDLRDRIREGGPLSPDRAATLGAEIADALQAIHAAGIVHRDLKPLNIMLDGQGRVRLMDFGIAKGLASGTGATGAGYVVGSPEYMSPEQARGRPVDARSDLYALGIVLYEMLKGAPPFRGSDPVTTLLMHVEEEPALDGIPEPLREVVVRALAKDPEQRFRTAMGMAQALRAAAAAIAAAPTERQRAIPSRRFLVPGVAVVLFVIAVLAWRWWPRGSSPPEVAPPSSAIPLPASTPSAAASAFPTRIPTVVASPAVVAKPQVPPASVSPAPLPAAEPSPTAVAAEPTPIPSASPEPTPTPAPTPSAEATPEVAPAKGRLNIFVEPWSYVSIDGQEVGQSPLVVDLEPGKHKVVVSHPDYKEFARTVTIVAGQKGRLSVDLTREGIRR